MKQPAAFLIAIALVIGLTASCTPYHAQGISAGALTGGIIGAAVNNRHPGTGAAVGAAAGGLIGGIIADSAYKQYYGPPAHGYYGTPQGYCAPRGGGYQYKYPPPY